MPSSLTRRTWPFGARATTRAPAAGTRMIDVSSGNDVSIRRSRPFQPGDVTDFHRRGGFSSLRRRSGRPSDASAHEPSEQGDGSDADAQCVVADVPRLEVAQRPAGETRQLADPVDGAVDDVLVEPRHVLEGLVTGPA